MVAAASKIKVTVAVVADGSRRLTGENGPPFALLIHAALLLPRHRERSLENKAPDVVALLEVGLPVLQLLVLQVGCDVRHLDVGVLGVQVLRVHLRMHRRRCFTQYLDLMAINGGVKCFFWDCFVTSTFLKAVPELCTANTPLTHPGLPPSRQGPPVQT